ncbi:MAG: SDR family NAD(P)-dependent oxidoreductase, partial [Gammaproteobacteria bacterium]|nr:SDR family NAD(P)-dependent oxidoreductase [Gammaproteobacteria bacterium]
DQLIDTLKHWLTEQPDELVFSGNSKDDNSQTAMMLEGEAGRAFLETAMANHELGTLAKLWVGGVSIDWESLSPAANAKRIPLPGYPFARESYWIPESVQPREPMLSRQRAQETTLYFHPQWLERPITATAEEQHNLLLFNHPELAVHLGSKGHTVIQVESGGSFIKTGENRFTVDPENRTDFDQLAQALESGDLWPGKLIYHCAPLDKTTQPDQGAYLFPLVYLIQGLAAKERKSPLDIISLGPLQAPSEAGCLANALASYGKTLHLESDRYHFRHLELSPDISPKQLAKIVKAELATEEDSPLIRYQNKQRQVLSYTLFTPSQLKEDAVPLHQNGHYLITGGAGGLGLMFAELLDRHYNAKLTLVGRSEPDSNKQARINKLGQARYLRTDITDSNQLSSMISEAKTAFGPIQGVIHTAGTIYPGFAEDRELDA